MENTTATEPNKVVCFKCDQCNELYAIDKPYIILMHCRIVRVTDTAVQLIPLANITTPKYFCSKECAIEFLAGEIEVVI